MASSGELEEVEEFVDLPDFANAKNRDLYNRLKETEKVRHQLHLHCSCAALALAAPRLESTSLPCMASTEPLGGSLGIE
jgi:hypothetical protein